MGYVWEQRKLKNLIKSEIKGKAKAEMKGNQSEYLDAERLNGGEKRTVNSEKNVDNDDVIILWDGSQAGTVYYGFSGALGSTLKAYTPLENGMFLFYYLRNNQQIIYDKYRTPNIPHVTKNFTNEFLVRTCTMNEQGLIGDFFQNFDQTIASNQLQLN